MLSASTQRALRIACVVALCCAVLLVIATVAWKALDRRPAWVMAVTASAQSESLADSLRDERRAFAAAIRVIGREHGVSPAYLHEVEWRDAAGRTFTETRTIVLRTDDQRALLTLYRRLSKVQGVTCSDPSRALRPPDAAFALLIVAFVLGLATLEPSGFPDEHVSMQPALVILNGLTLGLLSAAAVLVGSGWPGYLLQASFVLAFAPVIVWLIRIRVRWTACAALKLPYRTLVITAAVAFGTWVVRCISL
jgi:hypothetical protein